MGGENERGFAIWITGLAASGKTTVAHALSQHFSQWGISVQILDSDELRQHLTPDPTYTQEERDWFYSVVVYIAGLLTANGVHVLISATAPQRSYREPVREQIDRFAEVHVRCSPRRCREGDPKGLWKRAERKEITNLPGAGASYEPPESPDVIVDTERLSPANAAMKIVQELACNNFFPCSWGIHFDPASVRVNQRPLREPE